VKRGPAEWIATQRGAMLELLEELAGIRSGTYNKAEVDVRFIDCEGEVWFEERLRGILAQEAPPQTSAAVTTVSRRPPMPPTEGNRTLYRVVAAQADFLGIPVAEEHRAGVSDANLIAAEGTAVLDGLGPVGDLDHSDREYILTHTLVERCQLLTLTLDAVGRGPDQGRKG
jgi:glutamate carboxypeptidase